MVNPFKFSRCSSLFFKLLHGIRAMELQSDLTSSAPLTISQCVTLKLSSRNYLLWRSQFESFLATQSLLGLTDGSYPQPSPTLMVKDGGEVVEAANPAYFQWLRQDQLVKAWICGSLSEEALRVVFGLQTTQAVWIALSNKFNRVSVSRKFELQRRLQNVSQGGKSLEEYLELVQTICDQLMSIGFSVTDEEKVYGVLQGLNKDYGSISAVLANSMEDIPQPSYEDIINRLTSFDDRAQHRVDHSEVNPHLAFTAGRGYQNNWRGRGQSYGRSNNYRGRGFYSTRGRGFPQQNSAPGDRSFSSSSRVVCQICGKFGHPADRCYGRYDPPNNHSDRSYASSAFEEDRSYKELPTALATMRVSEYSPQSGHEWYPDTGATAHITSSTASLSTAKPYDGGDSVMVGNGEFLPITHIGSGSVATLQGIIKLDEVLVCPAISKSLLSVSKLTDDYPCSFEFDSCGVIVKDKLTGQVLMQGNRDRDLYVLPDKQFLAHFSNRQQSASEEMWHLRLGHTNREVLQFLSNKKSISMNKSSTTLCNGCQMGKLCRLPFSSSTFVSNRVLERLHCDVWGPSPVLSGQGFRYYVVFIDNFTRFSWFFPLKLKSDVFSVFLKFQTLVENQFQQRIGSFQSDGGGEFVNRVFLAHFEKHGIRHLISCPHTPQQNGLAERKHRHLVELSLSMMFHSKIPQYLWVEAFFTANFLINRLPSSVLADSKSPYECLFGNPPVYSELRVFGSLCYPMLRPWAQNKFDPKTLPCVFLGYNEKYKGYRCFHPPTSKVYISRHVVFEESEFPYVTCYKSYYKDCGSPLMTAWQISEISTTSNSSLEDFSDTDDGLLHVGTCVNSSVPVVDVSNLRSSSGSDIVPEVMEVSEVSAMSTVPSVASNHHMVTRSKDGIRKPNPRYVLLTVRNSYTEPKTVTTALKDPGWYKAMVEEMDTLHTTETWELVPADEAAPPLGCKWVFKTKLCADGSLDKLKARLVAKGYEQEEGIDYVETYSPVVRTATVRLVLHVATVNRWPIKQLDVKNAFLHGDLQELVFMLQPPGFEDKSKPHHVCRLKKSIYGLKQSPRAWFDKFSMFLLGFGFKCSISDPSLFIYHQHGDTMCLLLYVDDMLLTGSSQALIDRLIVQLNTEFRMKDLGPIHYFLGLQAHAQSNGLFLNQAKYASDLLTVAGMDDASPMPTPLPIKLDKIAGQDEVFPEPTYFRSLAGKLQYLTLTRPDLQYAVNLVCQRMHTPMQSDFTLLKRILRYVKGTLDMGLTLLSDTDSTLRAYSDSDWAGCRDTRRSTGGFCTFLGQNLISWSAKRQPTVSKSSTEAEYRSLSATASELTWISSLLREIGIPQTTPAELFCDNLSAVYLTANPVLHSRSKHFDVDFHYVREKVAVGSLIVKHIPAELQLADVFTKPLLRQPFYDLRFNLGVGNPDPSLRGYINKPAIMSSGLREQKPNHIKKCTKEVSTPAARESTLYRREASSSLTNLEAENTKMLLANNRFGILDSEKICT